jgi:hypothetical protein
MALSHHHLGQHAVLFAKRFVTQFLELIVCVLSCCDRIIFNGYLPFDSEDRLSSLVG